jgi:WD40 repeat protein/serine/threonine protein kinase
MDDESIFAAASSKAPGAERRAFLDEACGGDDDLRRRIERLLDADRLTSGILDRGLNARASPGAVLDSPVAEALDDRIGPYRLLQLIGEGGMGAVYMAEQKEPVRRRVALKVIKPGMDSRQVIARFEAERQALALMDHQNIARVLDAGTTAGGRPYFVMELVHGVPITQFCDDRAMTPRQRLELLVPVCQAIQHAHQKGIIHRDVKPSNVLVTMYDDKPVPKVIDFGVAKATEQPLTDRTLFTQFGALVGTFEYMSPEQAEMNALGVDTRSDIYSLGVLLYELLTGTTPLGRERLRQAALGELVRLIKEEEAPRPSARLSSSNDLRRIAAARSTDPARLSGMLRGELDWIVMKCLEKNRVRRYESASGLALDIQRYLADEPVEACPPAAGYRLRKLARKYRRPLRVAVGFVLVLVAGVVVSTAQAIRLARLNEEMRRTSYVEAMNVARVAWDENNPGLTLELLDQHRPRAGAADLRGFEWYYLDRLARGGQLRFNAHAGGVTSVAFTPDGKRLISSGLTQLPRSLFTPKGTAGDVKLWDAATGRPLPLALDDRADRVATVALSADGNRLAATCRDRTVLVWDLATGGLVTLEGPAGRTALNVGFSPDGKRLLAIYRPGAPGSMAGSGLLLVWDLASRKPVLTCDQLRPRVRGGSFSPDGKQLVVSSSSPPAFNVYDAETGRETFSHQGPEEVMYVMSARFSPNGKRLAASDDHAIRIWDLATHEVVMVCPCESPGFDPVYSPDGRLVARGGIDGIVELWDTATGRKVQTLKGHGGSVRDLAFSPDGARLATGGADGTVRVWDIGRPREAASLAGPESGSRSVIPALSPDGRSLLAIETRGPVRTRVELWDTATLHMRGDPIEIPRWCLAREWSADGARVYLADEGKTVHVIESASWKAVRTFTVDAEPDAYTTSLSPDERWYVHSGRGGAIRVRDAQTGAEARTIPGFADEIQALQISPDSVRLLGADISGNLKLWDIATGREIASTTLAGLFVNSVRFSRDGALVAVVGNRFGLMTGEVHVLDGHSARATWSLRGHSLNVAAVDFSPDGRRLATASADRTVRIWDLGTGREILKLSGGPNVNTLRFVPDGSRLIGASTDRSIRVWDALPLPE